ncbi:hypothetical protein BHE74_00003341 [Ensete ventricosum]|nr:hypothetical protein BHE74_00003341 [Ensete ventricosum]
MCMQVRRKQNLQGNTASGSNPELRRTSSLGRTWEETVADSVANELVLQAHTTSISSSQSGLFNAATENKNANTEESKNKPRDSKPLKSGQLLTYEEKKSGKSQDERRARPKKLQEFHNIRISQVNILTSDQFPAPFPKRANDGAGDGFVTSIRGLFNSQRRKAKAYVLRTMRGEADHDHGDWSDGDVEFSPFARQLTIAKTKKLIRRHSKKFSSRTSSSGDLLLDACLIIFFLISVQHQKDPSSPKETIAYESDSSGASSYGDGDINE